MISCPQVSYYKIAAVYEHFQVRSLADGKGLSVRHSENLPVQSAIRRFCEVHIAVENLFRITNA